STNRFNRKRRGCFDVGKYPKSGAIGELCSTPLHFQNVRKDFNIKHGSSRDKDRLEKQREKIFYVTVLHASSTSPVLLRVLKAFKSKEKEDLLCNSSPCFKHLSRIAIFCLEEVAHSLSLEEIINKEKGMSISNVHPDMTVPFGTLGSSLICSNSQALPSLRKFVVEDCPKAPLESFRDKNRNNEVEE
ncbi:hypothetical protein HID58_069821, partial [Brassica napus]